MTNEHDSISTDALLSILRQNMKQCCGLDTFFAIVQNAGAGIHVTRLRHLNTTPSPHAAEFDTYGEEQPGYIITDHSIPELPIPYIDKLTLKQAKAAFLKILEREREATRNNDYPLADDCREEREKFEDYFKKVINKRGKIKNIQDQTHDDYRLIKANLTNFLKKVNAFNPDYAAYIKAHLVFGYIMVWRE